jgi:hypothetical protein
MQEIIQGMEARAARIGIREDVTHAMLCFVMANSCPKEYIVEFFKGMRGNLEAKGHSPDTFEGMVKDIEEDVLMIRGALLIEGTDHLLQNEDILPEESDLPQKSGNPIRFRRYESIKPQ